MTKRECAIIMAYTGICMLKGDDFNIFHKYCEDLLGHPIFTHQFPMYEKEIKERSFEDFKGLCACSTVEPQRIKGRWTKAYDGYDGHVKCVQCFKTYDWDTQAQYYNFCPNCGADMRGEQDGKNS